MRGFLLAWIGQLLSVLGTSMSTFALSLWVFNATKSATAMASVQVAYTLPFLLATPVAGALSGLGNAFLWPAYSAAISVMVPKEQYGRANGLMSLVESGPGVVAPLLAGGLMPILGLTGILALDWEASR